MGGSVERGMVAACGMAVAGSAVGLTAWQACVKPTGNVLAVRESFADNL